MKKLIYFTLPILVISSIFTGCTSDKDMTSTEYSNQSGNENNLSDQIENTEETENSHIGRRFQHILW